MIANVQALRALAACLVVFVHLDVLLGALGIMPFGWGGVDIFFVISGFIMVHTTRDARPTPLRFFVHRLARIAPIYWLLTGLVFLLALGAPTLFQATRADVGDLICSLLFIPFQKSNGLTEPTLFVGWTLNYEMFFYALFALGLGVRNYLAGCACVVLALLALVMWRVLAPDPQSVAENFYGEPIVLEFAFGMGLGLIAPHLPQAAPRWASALLFAFMAAACVIWIAAAPYAAPHAPTLVTCGLPATLLVLIAIAAERWHWRVTSPLVLAAGDASYALYLTHPFVTQALQKLAALTQPTPLLAALLVLVAFVAVLGVAWLAHRFFERPLSKAARRLGDQLTTRERAAAQPTKT